MTVLLTSCGRRCRCPAPRPLHTHTYTLNTASLSTCHSPPEGFFLSAGAHLASTHRKLEIHIVYGPRHSPQQTVSGVWWLGTSLPARRWENSCSALAPRGAVKLSSSCPRVSRLITPPSWCLPFPVSLPRFSWNPLPNIPFALKSLPQGLLLREPNLGRHLISSPDLARVLPDDCKCRAYVTTLHTSDHSVLRQL